MNDSPKIDTYRLVTQQFLDLLAQGTVPWRQMWRPQVQGPGLCNGVSGHRYRGSNVILLGLQMLRRGYEHPYWVTWNQLKNLGGSVRKGEGGSIIIFYRAYTVNNVQERPDAATGRRETVEVERVIPLIRFTKAWNLGQTRDLDVNRLPAHQQWLKEAAAQTAAARFEPIEAARNLVQSMPNPPTIRHGIDCPGYLPPLDTVTMPHPEQYGSVEAYYAELFHELGHATGHQKRLAREGIMTRTRFGDLEYSKEELIAEIAAGFLCAEAGISAKVIANQAAYLNGWSQSLSSDLKLIVQAASKAQEAADCVLGIPRTQELDPSPPASLKAAEPNQAPREISAFAIPAAAAHPKTPTAPAPRPRAALSTAKPEAACPPRHRLKP